MAEQLAPEGEYDDEPVLFTSTGAVGGEIQNPPSGDPIPEDPAYPVAAEDEAAVLVESHGRFTKALSEALKEAGLTGTREYSRAVCAAMLRDWWGQKHSAHPPVQEKAKERLRKYLKPGS
jgi:hypothetical protein